MKKIIFLTLCIIFLFICCNQQQEENIMPDKKESILQWSQVSPTEIPWEYSHIYCQKLREGGFSDWRTPNIDELRTLIIKCPGTETSGRCRISEKNDCLSEGCYSKSCQSCPVKRTDILTYYHETYSKLGDKENLWSSSEFFGNNGSWYVSFSSGGIFTASPFQSFKIRCVRNN